MPLGDSLTWGYDGGPNNTQYLDSLDTGGYRSPLYQALGADNVYANYVGSSNGNPSPVLSTTTYPGTSIIYANTAQNGYNGYRIDDIANNLAASVPGSDGVSNAGGYWLTSVQQPNIILLQIGANDLEQDYDPLFTGTPGTESAAQLAQDTTTRLEALISQIMYYDPNTWIFTDGTPILLNSSFEIAASGDYESDVAAMVAANFAGKNVRYVNMAAGLAPGSFGAYEGDGVHLTTAGYILMGDTWATAIEDDYNFADVNSVPEPSTWALLSGGAMALLGWRKLRSRRS